MFEVYLWDENCVAMHYQDYCCLLTLLSPLHTYETAHYHIKVIKIMISVLNNDGKLKYICLSGSAIAKYGTAEEQSQAIVASFKEFSDLLRDWHDVTQQMYPNHQDLLDLISSGSSMCVCKVLGGMMSTNTCSST